jgi:hypothetical protein
MTLYRTITILSVLACIALASIVGWLLARQYVTPPPFAFSQQIYAPKVSTLCPGQPVQWTPTLTVTRAPTVLAVSRTIWDVTRHVTVQPDSQLDFFVWTEPERGEVITRPTTVDVPPDLAAGLYEVRVGASSFNSDASAYRVPFVVPESCFRGRP